MALKQGDTHKGWTVTEARENGLVILHKPCESCGCPTGMEWRTTHAQINKRVEVTKSHSCIKYLRGRLDALEAIVNQPLYIIAPSKVPPLQFDMKKLFDGELVRPMVIGVDPGSPEGDHSA